MGQRQQRIFALIAFIVTLLVNILANALPIAGRTTGQISDRFPVLFTPAGYVFSIWALIYLGLAAYAFYQVWHATKQLNIAPWFIASCVFNSTWIVAWHYGFLALSVALMLGLLVCLVGIYLKLNLNLVRPKGAERWVVNLPFRIYLGWIIVATVANVSIYLYDLGWDRWGLSDVFWTIAMMVVAGLIALILLQVRHDTVPTMVLIWAILGIALKHSAPISIAALATAFALVVALAVYWVPERQNLANPNRSTHN